MLKSLIRTTTYISKEFFELLRQPRLLFGLILTPFLILFLVGVGFRNEPHEFKTLFVVPDNPSLRDFVSEEAQNVSPQLIYAGMTDNVDQAMQRLKQGEVDLVVSVSGNPEENIEEDNKSWMVFYHDEIEPQLLDYMPFFTRVVVDEVNNRLLTQILEQEQARSYSLEDTLETSISSAEALESSLRAADRVSAQREKEQLYQSLNTLDLLLLAARPLSSTAGDGTDDLGALADQTNDIDIDGSEQNLGQQADEIKDVRQELESLRSELDTFQKISPRLLVSPFEGQARNVADYIPSMTDYFVGPVIALLLQHLAITFAGLSYVRDRQLGVTELIRVSPLKPLELLLGKYISHFLLSGIIATVLTFLAVKLLEAPMVGSWLNYAYIAAALSFASIGLGFVLSLLSESDSHAVQYAMMMLLASVFFTGFFFPLDSLWWPVQSISWLIPSTYGILMFHDVMLRGLAPAAVQLLILAGMGVLFFLLTWLILVKRLRAQESI